MLKNTQIIQTSRMHLRNLIWYVLICGFVLVGCTPLTPNLAQRGAQPKIPAARNFTSFSASLRCMDDLLLAAKRPRTLISSTGIPDRTNKLSVGADDMLLNAINQMNRKSGAYIFVDQSLERDSGQIAIFTPSGTAISPKLYVRGAISQIDSNVASSKLTLGLDDESVRTANSSIARTGEKSIDRGMTIVTVDMHLVSFPDKTVVPGSSVANSMVVTTRGFSLGATGLINVTALDASLTINRVESLGQAVRNLVELGAIELVGRHANVAYWECLNIPAVKQRRSNRKEIVFSSADKPQRIPEVQKMLQTLGYFSGEITGVVDQRTRDAISHFQANHSLIATGDLNYDTYQHLLEKTKGFAPRRRTAMPAADDDLANEQRVDEMLSETSDRIAEISETLKKKPIFSQLFSKQKHQKTTLEIRSARPNYNVGDSWQTSLIAPRGGFLTCFHQSNNDLITQIFPIQPDATFEVGKGQQILIPDPRDGFDIKFDRIGVPEKIICILEVDQVPASISEIRARQVLGPMNVLSFDHLIETYRTANPNIIWGHISEKG
jgi:peptidoglycan hydrolase-like protein with peptidoglycan-binding domain